MSVPTSSLPLPRLSFCCLLAGLGQLANHRQHARYVVVLDGEAPHPGCVGKFLLELLHCDMKEVQKLALDAHHFAAFRGQEALVDVELVADLQTDHVRG